MTARELKDWLHHPDAECEILVEVDGELLPILSAEWPVPDGTRHGDRTRMILRVGSQE